MKVTFLGTGTSQGVPVLGCGCRVCRSADPADKRLRTSAMVESGRTRLLIDCGPDLRAQLMPLPFRRIGGVLLTHIHYDHVGGIDDLRPYCRLGGIDVFANAATAAALRSTVPYCFAEKLYPGVPKLHLHTIRPGEAFRVGDIDVEPVEVKHGAAPIMAYRFGPFAYVTDMKTITPGQEERLRGVDTIAVNALRFERPHHSHMTVPEAVAFARRVGARRVFFTHATHDIGLHAEANSRLPRGFEYARDGLEIEV